MLKHSPGHRINKQQGFKAYKKINMLAKLQITDYTLSRSCTLTNNYKETKPYQLVSQ